MGSFFVVAGNFYYDRKKKIQSSVWRVHDHYYDNKKKRYSRLSGGCAIIITTGKIKVLVICLAGARSILRLEKKKSCCLSGGCAIVITTGKKSSGRLSGGCAIVITTGKKKSIHDFYAKLNVLNLNVTNLY